MSIFTNLDIKTMTKFNQYLEEEAEDFKIYTDGGIGFNTILGAINELKATRHTIAAITYDYEKAKHEYDVQCYKMKNSEEYISKYKAISTREEHAELNLSEEKDKLIKINQNLLHLKANRDGLIDEIKFMYRVLEANSYCGGDCDEKSE